MRKVRTAKATAVSFSSFLFDDIGCDGSHGDTGFPSRRCGARSIIVLHIRNRFIAVLYCELCDVVMLSSILLRILFNVSMCFRAERMRKKNKKRQKRKKPLLFKKLDPPQP